MVWYSHVFQNFPQFLVIHTVKGFGIVSKAEIHMPANMPANLENSAVATGLEKVSFHSNPKERKCQRMLKLLHNCTHLTLVRASKVMLKILQARLQQYVNRELPDVQAGFRKGRGTRDQIPNIRWIMVKAREFQKDIYFCFIDYAKAFLTVWITINCGQFFKRWEDQTT